MTFYESGQVTLLQGDTREQLRTLKAESVQCCVTSPPYWGLRDYGDEGQIGLEATPDEYIATMVDVFRELRRVLRNDGTLWLNIGDSYAGSWGAQGRTGAMASRSVISARQIAAHPQRASRTGAIPGGSGLKPKDLVGIPWMLAFALRADGWWLRQDIIWAKPNPMPESVTDRCTKAHEYLFLLTKSERYFYDADAIAEPGAMRADLGKMNNPARLNQGGEWRSTERDPDARRNKRSVWTVATAPYADAHFATFPPALIKPAILAGSHPGDTVIDPFSGSGTTAMVARDLGRRAVGIEINQEYLSMSVRRIGGQLSMVDAKDVAVTTGAEFDGETLLGALSDVCYRAPPCGHLEGEERGPPPAGQRTASDPIPIAEMRLIREFEQRESEGYDE